MGWFSDDKPKEEKKADVDRYKALKKAQNDCKTKEEGWLFWNMNSATAEAEKDVPWWRR